MRLPGPGVLRPGRALLLLAVLPAAALAQGGGATRAWAGSSRHESSARTPEHAYTLTVVSSAAGGDPGVLYDGGPMDFELHDARSAREAFRLCITPAPEDQPSCRSGHTGTLVSGPAPSASGTLRFRFTLPGGRVVDRSVQVVSNATAQRTHRVRILRAAALYERSTLGAVVRLDRALLAHGRPSVTAAPELLRGQVFFDHQRFFGGTAPGRIGAASSHCYAAEARRPEPRARPRRGDRWTVALADDRRVREIATATVATSGTLEAAARRLGCRL